ncbi:MAG: DUF177 domain-containing protein [Muribaculaceae bacterium]|nr:DUF177 domain-containing protein [Muribaculaceae bacterium]
MGKFTAFKLPLKSLAPGKHAFQYHLDKEFFTNMESADVHDADLTVDLAVDYNGHYYLLDFAIEGEVVLICDRCLDNLHYPIEASYSITVEYGEDYNDESDDVLQIPESDQYLNVAYMIYDTVALAIPIKHVHPLGKCNRQMSAMLKKHRATVVGDEDAELEEALIDEMDSLTPDGGAPGADPRWDALRKLSGSSENDPSAE